MGVEPKLHVRFLRFDWIVMVNASSGIERIIHPTEVLEPGKVLRHTALGLALHGRSGRRCAVLRHTATILSAHGRRTVLSTILGCGRCTVSGACFLVAGLAVLLVATAIAELDVIQDDDGIGLLLAGLIILNGLLVVAAGDVDEGSFLQLHLTDPFTQVTGRLDAQVDVAAVVLTAAVVDPLSNTEADSGDTIRFRETQSGTSVVPLADADIGCKEFEHSDWLLSAGNALLQNNLFQPV